ncbi:hypothetical protein BV22DRAFT_1127480 [Leucogyrophana mollusca]|uniref:Uncharacterized protein n=1 Tax=Leucogyrophana mollusca TaxID=85980 RepID=A0ACB8BN52_9AGAM|nr:hypothetical protein BV22DRAFT_1127480 [Leucogyrophana mollusca]
MSLYSGDRSGKYYLVNLTANDGIPETSSGAAGCLLDAEDYLVHLGDQKFRLWDIVASMSLPSRPTTLLLHREGLQARPQTAGGVTLLVLRMRDVRVTAPTQINQTFFNLLCDNKAPTPLVITSFENEHSMDWEENK